MENKSSSETCKPPPSPPAGGRGRERGGGCLLTASHARSEEANSSYLWLTSRCTQKPCASPAHMVSGLVAKGREARVKARSASGPTGCVKAAEEDGRSVPRMQDQGPSLWGPLSLRSFGGFRALKADGSCMKRVTAASCPPVGRHTSPETGRLSALSSSWANPFVS